MWKEDLKKYYEINQTTKFRKFILCLQDQGLQGVLIYRFGHWLMKQKRIKRIFFKPFYLFFNHRIKSKWGIEIDPFATIGKGFMIFHYGGIFIGGEAVIGDNFTIGHNVTVGVAGKGLLRGVPVIGDNVTVSPGATVHGKIKIGNNVKIGANAVVNKNIPDFALVQVQQMQVVTFPSFYNANSKQTGEPKE
jgi:serine O-acetyltransferase